MDEQAANTGFKLITNARDEAKSADTRALITAFMGLADIINVRLSSIETLLERLIDEAD